MYTAHTVAGAVDLCGGKYTKESVIRIPHTLYFTVYTELPLKQAVVYTLYTVQCTLYTVNSTLDTLFVAI